MYKKRNRRKVIKPRFYVFTAIAALIIGFGLYLLLRPVRSALITRGVSTLSLPVRAAVIRDEDCYSAEGEYGRVIYRAAEGDALRAGDPVAQVYKWGYTDDIAQRLYNAESAILDEQRKLIASIDNPELAAIDERIALLLDEALAIADTDFSLRTDHSRSLLDVQNDLNAAVTERTLLLQERIPAPEELVLLYNQRTQASDVVADWANDIIAAEDGTVSFYFDGFELALNAQKLDLLTSSLLQEAINSRGYSVIAGTTSYIYKLVDANHWYLGFLTKENSYVRLTPGETYHITFLGYEDTPFTGVALEQRVSDGNVINLLEINQAMGDLLAIRGVETTIGAEFSGLQVHSEAIYMRGSDSFVTVMQYGEQLEVKVNVLSDSNGFAVVRPVDDASLLYEGQRYLIP